jgi:hypothetical protein
MPIVTEDIQAKRRRAPWWVVVFLLPFLVLTPSAVSYRFPFTATFGNRQLILGRAPSMPDYTACVTQTTHWNPGTGKTWGGWAIFTPMWAYGITWSVKEPYPIGLPIIK